jgi:predicted DCC family thiol-disulfide oxidoreductase YuxK
VADAGLPLLVYDGDCAFCTGCVRFVERRVPTGARLVPFQFADLDALGTDRERAAHEIIWVDRDGRLHGGAQAAARLLMDAGGPWRPLGALLGIPPFRWAAHCVYRLVAANRHRLPGGTAACALPPAQRPGASPPS